MILRTLLALIACLLALAAPLSARTTASRLPVVPPPAAQLCLNIRDIEDSALTLHLDGLHDRAGPCGRVLVRQNPWSMFDPEGLCMLSPTMMANNAIRSSTGIDVLGTMSTVSEWVQGHPRTMGGVKAVGGAAEVALGVAGVLTPEPTMVTKVAGGAAIAHGADTVVAGVRQAVTGESAQTFTQQGIANVAEAAGASPEMAQKIGAVGDAAVGMATSFGVGTVTSPSAVAARVSAAEVAKSNKTLGAIDALVVPNGLVPKVFVGKSTNAGGPGAAGLAPEVRSAATQTPSRYNYGCAEGDALSQAVRAGVNPAGGASSARAVSTGAAMPACDNCSKLLKAFKVKDAHGKN